MITLSQIQAVLVYSLLFTFIVSQAIYYQRRLTEYLEELGI